MFNSLENREDGFTIVEMLVSVSIGMLILGISLSMFYVQRKTFSLHEESLEMQQNSRAALDMMTRDVRMAGPNNAGGGLTVSQSGTITFFINTDSITYKLDADDNEIERRENAGNYQPIAENIESLNFAYGTDSVGNINTVAITIVARSDKFDGTYAGDGFRRATMTTTVNLRN